MLITILHFSGFVLGVGGAFISDALFLNSIRDGKLNATEGHFLKLVSRIVWLGLSILIISGLFRFSLSPDFYLASSKFLAKMTVVTVILINGLIFHFYHLPFLMKHLGKPLRSIAGFSGRWKLLVASGAVSMVSWTSALILGIFDSLPFPYWQIVGVYGCLVLGAISAGLIFRRWFL